MSALPEAELPSVEGTPIESSRPGPNGGQAKAALPTVSIIVVSKDEPQLSQTLAALGHELGAETGRDVSGESEVVVVDASSGRLDGARSDHPWVGWVDFDPPQGRVTIACQRNAGVRACRGDIVVFVDSGCVPCEGWLGHLVAPIARGEELVVSGPATGPHNTFERLTPPGKLLYLEEAPTINLAVHRSVFDRVGSFDEAFSYGSDVDFTWRVVDAGIRIRYEALASVEHDWGNFRRRMRRARQYGAARARLYRKHPERVLRALYEDPVPFVYPLWLLGLPIALRRRAYLLLLALPLWRARKHASPAEVVLAHLFQGVGSLSEVTGWVLGWGVARAGFFHVFRRAVTGRVGSAGSWRGSGLG